MRSNSQLYFGLEYATTEEDRERQAEADRERIRRLYRLAYLEETERYLKEPND